MKVLAAVLLVFTVAMSQPTTVELKGIVLGKPLTAAQEISAPWSEKLKLHLLVNTTLAGIEGSFAAGKNNDGRVHTIIFVPSGRTSELTLDRVVGGLNKKYGISLKWNNEEYGDGGYYHADKGEYVFEVTADHNKYLDSPYEIRVMVRHSPLFLIRLAELQVEANEDF